MEEKIIRLAAIVVAVFAVSAAVILPWVSKLRAMETDRQEELAAEAEQQAADEAGREMTDIEISTEEQAQIADGRLHLRIPEGTEETDVIMDNNYLTQKFRITIPGADASYFNSEPIAGSSNHIAGVSYALEAGAGILEISLDAVYEPEIDFYAGTFYFDFLTPHELYDKVIVMDAGHGGKAPGAVREGVMEKDIDLAIIRQFDELAREYNRTSDGGKLGVYYTRTDDSNPTFSQRVGLANRTQADLFISVHNNSLPGNRMTETKGTQVMYNEESEASRHFAQICLDNVTEALGSVNRGTIKGDSIYIIRNSDVPVALIEVGFMTNREELDLLQTPEYQKKTAEGILKAVLEELGI